MGGWRETALMLGAYGAYNVVRAAFGGTLEEGRRNAERIERLERQLGIDVEERWQRVVERRRLGMPFWSGFYLVSQVVALPLSVFLANRLRPGAYPFVRASALISWTAGLVWYATQPVAPPRLMDHGPSDTVSRDTPIDLDSGLVRVMYNPIAAMPSLHVGLAPIVGGALALLAPRPVAPLVLVGYPLAVTISVIVTGNHYVLDVAGGLLVVAPSAALAGYLVFDDVAEAIDELRPGRPRRGD